MHGFDRYEAIVPEVFRGSELVFLAAAIPAVQRKVLEQCVDSKFIFADTVDMWIERTRSDLLEVIARVDGLFLNDAEARQLTGLSSGYQAAQAIRELGPKWVILKKGEHGCLIVGPGTTLAFPAFPTASLVDPTGAGDSFAGGLLGTIAASYAESSVDIPRDAKGRLEVGSGVMAKAMRMGTAVASFTIESFSLDALRTVSRNDLDQRVKALDSLVGCCE
jgi:sugar/nucleoside kinase (ribokinase family)